MQKCPVCGCEMVDGSCESFECWERQYCKEPQVPVIDSDFTVDFHDSERILV